MAAYMVVAIKDIQTGEELAMVMPITEQDNLASILQQDSFRSHRVKAIQANLYPTRRQASNVALSWNARYKEDGTYMGD